MAGRSQKTQIRAASYNIHSWRGMDGRYDPARILAAIDSLNVDMLALQEVVSPNKHDMPCSLTELADAHGYHATFGQTMLRTDSRYGNALLSKKAPTDIIRHDISYTGREPRGALEAFFSYGELTLKVICTHLGLRRKERASQMATLLPIITDDDADVTMLMGDFNDWFGFSRMRRLMHRTFGVQPTPRTFPSRFPIFSLDQIHVLPGNRLTSLHAVKDESHREASDHLPLQAIIDIRD